METVATGLRRRLLQGEGIFQVQRLTHTAGRDPHARRAFAVKASEPLVVLKLRPSNDNQLLPLAAQR